MKYFYAWVGQNATCGTPHPKTGRFNKYGDLRAFSSRAKRDQFVRDYSDITGNCSAYVTNLHDAKSNYFAGMSQYNFDNYVQYHVNMQLDEG